MNIMSASQVKDLFAKEAVLMGTEDMVPSFRAVILFGQDAVDHVHAIGRTRPGIFVSGYGVGDFTLKALTLRGFQAAASFYNVQRLREEAAPHDQG